MLVSSFEQYFSIWYVRLTLNVKHSKICKIDHGLFNWHNPRASLGLTGPAPRSSSCNTLQNTWPLQSSIPNYYLKRCPVCINGRSSARLAQFVLETSTIILHNLDVFVGHMVGKVREGPLKLNNVCNDVLFGTMLRSQTIPGIPVLLIKILGTIVLLEHLSKELTRLRRLI
jgi:hypothetical protein